MTIRDAVLPILRDPAQARALDLRGWDQLVRQGRRANLLARLGDLLESQGLRDAVPEPAWPHFFAAQCVGARQRIATRAEIERIKTAFDEVGLPLVLLKGAAYLAAGLRAAEGRIFGDIDLLVPRGKLAEAESVLLRHGWISAHLDAYDQRYYRQWMHELPPLRHMQRSSTLDVHHNILPLTARHPPDAQLLLDAAIPAAALAGVFVLAPADMVLHSACHLFHEGELDNGLRDLADLDRLLREFGSQTDFWTQLHARAADLHLKGPLRYALRMCALLLETPLPVVARMDPPWPANGAERVLEALYRRGLRPNHPDAGDRWTPWARAILYLRGHGLRMPPHLLTAHLLRKAWRRWSGLDGEATPAEREKK